MVSNYDGLCEIPVICESVAIIKRYGSDWCGNQNDLFGRSLLSLPLVCCSSGTGGNFPLLQLAEADIDYRARYVEVKIYINNRLEKLQ